jgi:uncharacterized protein YhdP
MSKEALAQANVTVIGQAQLEQGQITQLTVALKQQVVKKIFESQSLKSTNSCMGEVAREISPSGVNFILFIYLLLHFVPLGFLLRAQSLRLRQVDATGVLQVDRG